MIFGYGVLSICGKPSLSTFGNVGEILHRTVTQPRNKEWLNRIETLAERSFQNVGYQTSVPKYHGSGSERGCVMDYLNYPLNDRRWLEDQFDRIARLADKSVRLSQIGVVRNWENPGAGGYYDAIGHVGRSPRMVKLFNAGDAMQHYYELPMPTQRALGPERRGLRFAWHTYHGHIPTGITYTGLDPRSDYTVKHFSQRSSPILIDGKPAQLIRKGETYDQVTEQEFQVPPEAVEDSRIVLTWAPLDQPGLNWRQHHCVNDIWVIPHAPKPK